jgi:hypothetical protein
MGTKATETEIPYSIFAHGIVGATPGVTPSDSELFVLNLAAELLLATKSTAILSEELPPFGGGGPPQKIIDLLLRCQMVVEEVIGVGRHGMMRMQSGDWSDLIMSRVGISYNSKRYKNAVNVSESSLNAAMASRVFARWAEALKMAQAAPSSNKLPPPPVLAPPQPPPAPPRLPGVAAPPSAAAGAQLLSRRASFAGRMCFETARQPERLLLLGGPQERVPPQDSQPFFERPSY